MAPPDVQHLMSLKLPAANAPIPTGPMANVTPPCTVVRLTELRFLLGRPASTWIRTPDPKFGFVNIGTP